LPVNNRKLLFKSISVIDTVMSVRSSMTVSFYGHTTLWGIKNTQKLYRS